MCLNLPYREATLWKKRANELVSNAAAANIPIDPLLAAAPRLSKVVSLVGSVKTRHGYLIEDALIAAIKHVPGWTAAKNVVPRSNGKIFKTDCCAVNHLGEKAFIFECKRQYSSSDETKKRTIDERLDELAKEFPAYAMKQGWKISTTEIFILSFYGTALGSKYPMYDQKTVSALFPPCAVRFVRDFIDYTETVVGLWAADNVYGRGVQTEPMFDDLHHSRRRRTNLFYLLDDLDCAPDDMIEIGEDEIRVLGRYE